MRGDAGALAPMGALLALALVGAHQAIADSPQSTGASMSPGRHKAMVTVIGGDVFQFGGDLATQCSTTPCKTDQIVRFSPTSSTATVIGAPLPQKIASAAIVTDGSHAYLFGGCMELPTCYRAGVTVFTPPSSIGAGPDLPSARTGARAAWINGHAYLFGGFPSSGQEILRYNPSSNDYTVMTAQLPSITGAMTLVTDGSVAYLFGGYDGAGTYHDRILRYDPAADRLETLPLSLPTARADAAGAWIGGAVYLFGGRLAPDNVRTDEILRFSPSPPALQVLGSRLATPRDGIGAAVVGGTVFLFGGRDASSTLTTIEAFHPSSNAAPTAAFTVATAGLGVSVDATASSDAEGAITDYGWNWGDGSPAGAGRTATHTYPRAGTWTITLTVHDAAGVPGTKTKVVVVGTNTTSPVAPSTSNPVPATTGEPEMTWEPEPTPAGDAPAPGLIAAVIAALGSGRFWGRRRAS